MPKKRCLSTNAAKLLAVTLIALVFVERPLEAYADPGSGLLMWQLLGAVILGAAYQVRRAVQKLRGLTVTAKSHTGEGARRGSFVS